MSPFFEPKSIAIIGASANRKKVGFAVFKNLHNRFKGKIYLVNPNENKINGIKTYANVCEIQNKINLAIIVVPAQIVLEVIEDCGSAKIKNVVIISAGFREIGLVGQKLEEKLLTISKKYGIKILGPNCLGFINNYKNINATFSDIELPKGPVAFISQSGALGSAIFDIAQAKNIGFAYFVSLGNELNFDETSVIEEIAKDKKVKVICCYLEGINDPDRFKKVLSKVARGKPVILLKSGKTKKGIKAVSCHTGSMAGSYESARCLFEKLGIMEVDNLEELFHLSYFFAYQKIPNSKRIAIITNAGGPGVLATDFISKTNLELSKLKSITKNKLKKLLPSSASVENPIDIIGDADAHRYKIALENAIKDKSVDSLLIILTPQAMTEVEKTARVIVQASNNYKKPILVSFIGGGKVKKGIEILKKNHIFNFDIPEQAISVLKKAFEYKKTDLSYYSFKLDKKQIKKIEALLRNEGFLPFNQAVKVFKFYKIPILKSIFVKNEKEVLSAAEKIGYPLALRIVSKTIIHKTDVGGVILDLKSPQEFKKSFQKMKKDLKKNHLEKEIDMFEISEKVPGGVELILGAKRDSLGHIIMFGWGGVYTEILKDYAFKMAPLNRNEVLDMIKKTKVYKILKGTRGESVYNINMVVDSILKISDMVTKFPQISELDINPLRMCGKNGKIIDIKMKVEFDESEK